MCIPKIILKKLGSICGISEKNLHFGVHYVVVGVVGAIPNTLFRWIIRFFTQVVLEEIPYRC